MDARSAGAFETRSLDTRLEDHVERCLDRATDLAKAAGVDHVTQTALTRLCAERRAADLKQKGLLNSAEIHQYLNRLADMLFTLARYAEEKG